jgi:nucleoside-diphosphate-sugar epimerase
VTRLAETGVPDDAYAAARSVFEERELVDLTIAISLMNAYNPMAISFRNKIGDSARAFSEYESRVLGSPTLFGIVLRYGFFYGPGTWYRPDGVVAEQVRKREPAIIGEGNAVWSFVHIDDAIAATVASLTAEPGIYNVVDDDPLPVSEWLPAFARWVDAPEPPRVSDETALETAGAEAVYYHRSLTGASNGRAKEKLGFAPRPLLWKS